MGDIYVAQWKMFVAHNIVVLGDIGFGAVIAVILAYTARKQLIKYIIVLVPLIN